MKQKEIAARLRELLQNTHDRKAAYEVSDGPLAGVAFAFGYLKRGIEGLLLDLEGDAVDSVRRTGRRRQG